MPSTKRRLKSTLQSPNKKQKLADDVVDLKIDAALQSIESLYESLYDDEGTISTTNQSKIAHFQRRMKSMVKCNEAKTTELAYRQTVGEQIKRLCDKVSSSDFARTIVKGLRFVQHEYEEQFNADWNQGQYISTNTADIALKRRSPCSNYIGIMRELLNEHTLTDTISDIISGFCSNDVIWYRIDSYSSSTDTYQEFNSSGFQRVGTDEDDLFRGPTFYKPRDKYEIWENVLTVKELRRDLDESAMSQLTDLEVRMFFVDVCEALFNTKWRKAEEWILEGTAYDRDR